MRKLIQENAMEGDLNIEPGTFVSGDNQNSRQESL